MTERIVRTLAPLSNRIPLRYSHSGKEKDSLPGVYDTKRQSATVTNAEHTTPQGGEGEEKEKSRNSVGTRR